MATTTPNIGLTLPAGAEGWKRSVINGNFMILDTKIGAVGNTPLQDQINTLSSQIAYYTDAQVTISSADLINVDLPSLSGRKILAVSFIYNNDYYYAIIDDNRQLYVSLRDTNNTITVLQKGGTRTTDRTVTVRVHYALV